MAKQIAKKEYVLVDFDNDVYRRFKIEILSVAHNQFHIISTHGNINSKGRETMVRTNNINEAYKVYDKQIYLNKLKGYENIEKAKKAYKIGMKTVKEEQKKKIYSTNKKVESNTDLSKEPKCDLCNNDIPSDKFDEIKKWARGGGGWDLDKTFIGYKKVLCIECQIDHEIYKKSFKKPTKSKTSLNKKIKDA